MALRTISHSKPSWSSTLKTIARMFLWHVCTFPPIYTASYSRTHLQSHCREKLKIVQQWHYLCSPPKRRYTLSAKLSNCTVTSHLTEKLSKLRSFDRQYRRSQNCPFQSSFTQRSAQFTQGIPQFCFYPPQSHKQEDTHHWKTWWETCAVPENIQFSFSRSFLHS